MELATTLQGQTVQNRVRDVGINLNHWYPVAWAAELKSGQVMPVTLWQQAIALYRDSAGQVRAMADACPHKGIELHKGEVKGDCLVCPYHGWEFNGEGECSHIPYYPKSQKLPQANARSYPTQEKYGIVWIFPGIGAASAEENRAWAEQHPLPTVPEYDNPRWLLIPITGKFDAHFSICNENTMDVFHGYLHKDLQGWFDPELLQLSATDDSVSAAYRVRYQGGLSKFLGLSKDKDGVTTRIVSINYNYPHYYTSLEGVSCLHLMRLPVGPNQTRSFSLLFLDIQLPKWLLNPVRSLFVPLIRDRLFMKFLDQDVSMMESEQRTYRKDPDRRYVEVNPAIIALQRLIVKQHDQHVQHVQQFSQSSPSFREENLKASRLTEAAVPVGTVTPHSPATDGNLTKLN
jgi:renierapurpurin 18,18'-hydroxylase